MRLLLAICLTSVAGAAEPLRDFYLMKSGAASSTLEFRLVEEEPRPGFRRVKFHALADAGRAFYVAPGVLVDSRDVESVEVRRDCRHSGEKPFHGLSVSFRKDRAGAIEKRLTENLQRLVGVFSDGELIMFARLAESFSTGASICGARGTLEDARLLARRVAGVD